MPTEPDKNWYRQICERQPIPIHSQAWWLDAVCGENGWGVRVIRDKEDQPSFAFPFGLSKKYGQTILKNPPLSTYLSPWIRYPDAQMPVRQYGFTIKMVQAWHRALPSAVWHSFLLHPEWKNGMAFHREGYQLLTRYTYQLKNIQHLDVVWQGVKNTVRTEIRKANEIIDVKISKDIDVFYRLITRSYARNKTKVPLTQERLEHLVKTLSHKEKGAIYLATDKEGNCHAGALVLWESNRAYYSLSGSDPKFRKSGATNALIWKILEDLSEKNCRHFDFEGSMLANVEPVFRYFGGDLVPYLYLQKFPKRWMYWLQNWRNA